MTLSNLIYSPLYLPEDGQEERIDFTGGLSAQRDDNKLWHILPIMKGSHASTKGAFSIEQLAKITKWMGVRPIYLKETSLRLGKYTSNIHPMLPEHQRGEFGAREAWQSAEIFLYIERQKTYQDCQENSTERHLPSPVETQINYISNSLQSLEKCLANVCWAYTDDLTIAITTKKIKKLTAQASNDEVNAAVNAFFVHIGVIRDHLSKLIAISLGLSKSIDSLKKLAEALQASKLPNHPIIDLLIQSGNLAPSPTQKHMTHAGWLAEITSLRNYFTHERPYGTLKQEKLGSALPLSEDEGLYKYKRFLIDKSGNHHELLDLLSHHYHMLNRVLIKCAKALDLKFKVRILSDRDMINQQFHATSEQR